MRLGRCEHLVEHSLAGKSSNANISGYMYIYFLKVAFWLHPGCWT